MRSNKPYYLCICICVCNLIAHACTSIHFFLIHIRIVAKPEYFKNIHSVIYKPLFSIWQTRIVKRMISILIRSPLRMGILKLVNFSIPLPIDSGCIIIICHTPWKRLLIQWCIENNFCLIIADGKWKTNRGGKFQRSGTGVSELRNIIKFLQNKGRLIMTADNFNALNNFPVKFLGMNLNAGLLPTRFARIANVSLHYAIPVFNKGNLYFKHNPPLESESFMQNKNLVIENFLNSLENEIKLNPIVCNFYEQNSYSDKPN